MVSYVSIFALSPARGALEADLRAVSLDVDILLPRSVPPSLPEISISNMDIIMCSGAINACEKVVVAMMAEVVKAEVTVVVVRAGARAAEEKVAGEKVAVKVVEVMAVGEEEGTEGEGMAGVAEGGGGMAEAEGGGEGAAGGRSRGEQTKG